MGSLQVPAGAHVTGGWMQTFKVPGASAVWPRELPPSAGLPTHPLEFDL